MVSAQEGSDYEEDLEPVIEEADDVSQPVGEVWTDGLPTYRGMEYDHQYVIHDDRYVTDRGVHTNQVECLWSLLQPWLEKFRSLSKQGLEQAARTYGFLRSLNLTGAPIHGLIDCIAVNVFRQFRQPTGERVGNCTITRSISLTSTRMNTANCRP